ncbi:MAG: SulP family inorganic anion transporter [Planctomycetota bacterium]
MASADSETQTHPKPLGPGTLIPDLRGGLVVFLVALPLCLGIALASGAGPGEGQLPLMSGLLAGIVGGLVVGAISKSHTSVSGPAAGLTAIVLAQVAACGSPGAFLLAVMLGGLLQIGMGLVKAGALSAFFPTSVIKGLLAAIGVILILKQIPHLVGHDKDPEGDFAFSQVDGETTLSEIQATLSNFHWGAALIGISCLVFLVVWERVKVLKNTGIPGQLLAVLLGVIMQLVLATVGSSNIEKAAELMDEAKPFIEQAEYEMEQAQPYLEQVDRYELLIKDYEQKALAEEESNPEAARAFSERVGQYSTVLAENRKLADQLTNQANENWSKASEFTDEAAEKTEWTLSGKQLVEIPVAESITDFRKFLSFPDFTAFANPNVYLAALTIAIVASLETLLNLEAVDKLDTLKRHSPPNRELIAQGCGNMVAGLIGGLPVTSVIVRSSVNVNVGAKTKVSAIFHGFLLIVCVFLFPQYLNMIPMSSLAAILLVTGFKLASPTLFKQMWGQGRYQFAPFLITLVAIVFTDLLIGIVIGLLVSALFILNSNLRRPVRRIVEKHLDGEITHIELGPQVSFLNRGALDTLLSETKPDTHLLIDATHSDYIDPDVLGLIRDFKDSAPGRGVRVSLRGFREKYNLEDELLFADFSTRELQERSTPGQVLETLKNGNARFVSGNRVARDLGRQVNETAKGENPFAAVLSGIDSRVPLEIIFDQGIGDMFVTRVAGNIVGSKALASLEYAVSVGGVKLVVVMGHTRCGVIASSVEFIGSGANVNEATGCDHLNSIVDEVSACVTKDECASAAQLPDDEKQSFVDDVARRNVLNTVEQVSMRSKAIAAAVQSGELKVIGALYDVASGKIEFFESESSTG